MTTTNQTTNKPVAELRDGGLKIAIFENPKKDGDGVRYSGKLTRSYVDQQGEWHETNYFSGSELLRAANLLIEAYNTERKLKADAKTAADGGAQ